MTISISLEQAGAYNIARHGLSYDTVFSDSAQVARQVLGLQAQILNHAALSIAARFPGYTQKDFRRDLYEDRTLIKSWFMRGTLHLVSSLDHPLFTAAIGEPHAERVLNWLLEKSLTYEDLPVIARQLTEALKGGPLDRVTLHNLIPQFRSVRSFHWGQDVKYFCYKGLLVHAEPVSNRISFALIEEWLPKRVEGVYEQDRKSATYHLFHRYLHCYGPATPGDFARWSGVPLQKMPWIRDIGAQQPGPFESDPAIEVFLEGYKAPRLFLQSDLKTIQSQRMRDSVFALPGFDPLVLGHGTDRRRFIDPAAFKRLQIPHGFIKGTLWSKGRIVGGWEYKVRRASRTSPSQLLVNTSPFAPLKTWEKDGLEVFFNALAPSVGADEAEVLFDR